MFRFMVVRLLLMFLCGGSCVLQSVSTGNKLALGFVFSWVGVNAMWIIGLPCLLLVIYLSWGGEEHADKAEAEVTMLLRLLLSPFVFLSRCLYNVFFVPEKKKSKRSS